MNSCYRFVPTILLLSISFHFIFAQVAPKREFRGAWIATVVNLDWPALRNPFDGQGQREELGSLLDHLAATGINAVVFQIRTECDALYNSPYEPWSFWLTGTQGTAPFDGYDPLEFAVEEAHKRGMEIHAWFNPYRAVRNTDPSKGTTYSNSPQHVASAHPEWILAATNLKILNPGLPQVRNHVATVIADVVRRYDIDGVHMDDYFYPYPEYNFTNQDAATFAAHSRGFTDIGDWRRDNVNLLIRQIYDSVQVIKPHVKFGMSPFGIWRPSNPPGIFGLDAYNTIYCDALAWIRGKYIDYITPQLYWSFGGGQDYGKLQSWWSDSAYTHGRHLYTGNITTVGASEIGRQIDFNRGNPKVGGSIIFRANLIATNSGGVRDLLAFGQYRTPALIPMLSWKDTVKPNPPSNLRAAQSATANLYDLRWERPAAAADGDTALRYIVYRFTKSSYQPSDLEDSRNLLALSGQTAVTPPARIDTIGVQYYFEVASLDRNNNESPPSGSLVTLGTPPTTPLLAYPLDAEQNFPKGDRLKWLKNPTAIRYKLQVARSEDFSPTSLTSVIETSDTAVTLSGLAAQSTYYWRVVAGNQGGVGIYTAPRSFRTGWPLPPTIVWPTGVTMRDRFPTLTWTSNGGTTFRVQIINVTAYPNIVEIDTTVSDTTCVIGRGLIVGRIYDWKVIGTNTYGTSDWSAPGRFRIDPATLVDDGKQIPTEFALSQNYPNPFNSATTIRFSVAERRSASLKLYDVLGREVCVLVDGVFDAGTYTVPFNAHDLPSGVYFYRLLAGEFIEVKKLQLLR